MSKEDDTKNAASETAPDQRWKLQVFYLCFYGFMTQIRPGESFITPYLLGADHNFTRAEVSHGEPIPHCLPFWTRSPPWGWPEHPPVVLGQGGVQACLGKAACGAARWCFLMGRRAVWYAPLWQHVLLGCEVTPAPKSQAQLSLA